MELLVTIFIVFFSLFAPGWFTLTTHSSLRHCRVTTRLSSGKPFAVGKPRETAKRRQIIIILIIIIIIIVTIIYYTLSEKKS